MKKIIALLLSVLCIASLFCACGENEEKNAEGQTPKASFNFGGNGLEFGITKKEINEIGKEISGKEEFDIDKTFYSASITQDSFRDSFTEGVEETLYPIVQYYFDGKDKLYSVKIWSASVIENDAEIILNNVMSKYGETEKYKETEYNEISAFVYEDHDIHVLVTYNYYDIIKAGTLEIYLTAPGYDHPQESK